MKDYYYFEKNFGKKGHSNIHIIFKGFEETIEDFNVVEEESFPQGGLAEMNDGSHLCTVCQKIFKDVKTGIQHFNEQHQATQQAQCQICHQVFKNKRYRAMHYKRNHKISGSAIKNMIVPKPKL